LSEGQDAQLNTAGAETRKPDYSLGPESPASKLLRECIADARSNPARQDRDRQDWRALLFYRGGPSQWTIWDKSTSRYVERGTDPARGGLPEYIPRPVTNIFALKVDGIVSLLNQSEPAKEFSPKTSDEKDIATAEVAEDALPVLLEEIDYADDIKPRTNMLIALTDKAYWVPYYDNDPKHGTQVIPDYKCTACGQIHAADAAEDEETGEELPCQVCGAPLEMAIGADGVPEGEETPIGKLCCELVPSFEGSLPKAARIADAKKNPWFLMHTRMDSEKIRRTWKRAASLMKDGGSKSSHSEGLSRHFADAMSQLSSPSRAKDVQGGAGPTPDPVIYRLFHDPIVSDDYYFPGGLYIVAMDDNALEASALPVTDDEGRPVKNVVTRQFASAPGTSFGKPPADDMIPVQETRNITEALIQLINMHDAAPTMYIPLTVTLENQPTGAPGETIFYRSLVPGDKPSKERGINPPESLYKQIEICDQKLDEISGMNGILQGERPAGDPTLGEIERLQENGLAKFKTPLANQVKAEKELVRLLLWIARRSAWSPRFRQIRGDNGEWDVKQFTGADLDGCVDVQIDPASAWPNSQRLQRMRLKEAFEMGLFPPPTQDPELAQKVLSMMNLAMLKPSIDLDRKQVARKLDRWKAATSAQEITPPDQITENLPVHLFLLGNFLKTEEFEWLAQANGPLAEAMKAHVGQIGQMLAAKAAAENAPADMRSPAEKGDGSALDAAVSAGALHPADQSSPQSPMDALMAAGALAPAAQAGPSVDQIAAQHAAQPVAGSPEAVM
jgi:hypothetical protein